MYIYIYMYAYVYIYTHVTLCYIIVYLIPARSDTRCAVLQLRILHEKKSKHRQIRATEGTLPLGLITFVARVNYVCITCSFSVYLFMHVVYVLFVYVMFMYVMYEL